MQTVGLVLRKTPMTLDRPIGADLVENYYLFMSKCPSCIKDYADLYGFSCYVNDHTKQPYRRENYGMTPALKCCCGSFDEIKAINCSYALNGNPTRSNPAYYTVLIVYSVPNSEYRAPYLAAEHNYLKSLTSEELYENNREHRLRTRDYFFDICMGDLATLDNHIVTNGRKRFLHNYHLRIINAEPERHTEIYEELVREFASKHSLEIPPENIIKQWHARYY